MQNLKVTELSYNLQVVSSITLGFDNKECVGKLNFFKKKFILIEICLDL